jgi:hypothetical protein
MYQMYELIATQILDLLRFSPDHIERQLRTDGARRASTQEIYVTLRSLPYNFSDSGSGGELWLAVPNCLSSARIFA